MPLMLRLNHAKGLGAMRKAGARDNKAMQSVQGCVTFTC